MRSRTLAALALCLAATPNARAQCPEWADDLHANYVGTWPTVFGTYDSGDGPEMIIGGFIRTAGQAIAGGIVRWNGTRFASLDGGTDGQVKALALYDDGSGTALIAGGQFEEAGGQPAKNIASWDGTSWSALGTGLGSTIATDVTQLGVVAGQLVAFGHFDTAGGIPATDFAVWDGTSWSVPHPGPNGTVADVQAFDDGSGEALYVCGSFTSILGLGPTAYLARWTGTNWLSAGHPNGYVGSLAVFDDGAGAQLYASGGFTMIGGNSVSRVASWDGTSWTDQGFFTENPPISLTVFDDGGGPDLYGMRTNKNGEPPSRVTRLTPGSGWGIVNNGAYQYEYVLTSVQIGTSERLAQSGFFFEHHGPSVGGPATWDGTEWTRLETPPQGIGGSVHALARYDDGSGEELYVGGAFLLADAELVAFITRRSGTTWASLDQGGVADGTGGMYYQDPTAVHALAVYDDDLYVGGNFTRAGSLGTGVNYLGRYDASGWDFVGVGTSAPVHALHVIDLGAGDVLVLGGEFMDAGGSQTSYISTWDGTAFTPLDLGVDNTVRALATFQGDLIAGGDFERASGVYADHVARWDGTDWFALGAGLDGDVQALTVYDDGSGAKLYAGGRFDNAGGAPASRVACWDGTAWCALPGPFVESATILEPQVHALGVVDGFGPGPMLAVGGRFNSIGALDASHLALWDGSAWSSPGGTNGVVQAFEAQTAKLTLGGSFGIAGGRPSACLAILEDTCLTTGVGAFCFGTGATCPCGNAGSADAGCDIRQATGGVRLSVPEFQPDGFGGGFATLSGAGFPPSSTPTVVAIRSSDIERSPPVFGDGLRCVGTAGFTRVGAAFALSGSSARSIVHNSGPGSYYYQLWFRNTPATFCTPDAFNLSNGYKLTW